MSSLNKGIGKVEVRLKWDPNPLGEPPADLDIIAATYRADDPHGQPAYLVYFDGRSPDGTITLNRDSLTGQGLGYDEIMTLELDRLAPGYGRVVVGVVIQQNHGRLTFGQVAGTGFQVMEGHTALAEGDFGAVATSTAATVAEFTRDTAGDWHFHPGVHGYDGDPNSFAKSMGNRAS
jgi:tellurium resistance protein TerD